MLKTVRSPWLWTALAAAAILHLAAVSLLTPGIELRIGSFRAPVPTVALVAVSFLLGLSVSLSIAARWRLRVAHKPSELLPRLLSRKVRTAIQAAYGEGRLDEAEQRIREAANAEPNDLGLQYWHIRLLLDLGRHEEARVALLGLLPRLPEAALSLRWSALYEAAGEQELWIRNVLERIRAGSVVRRSTLRRLIDMLAALGREDEALEILERLREVDPPAPEEEIELSEQEMQLRIRLAERLIEDGRFETALKEAAYVREHYSGWYAPYAIAVQAQVARGEPVAAARTGIEGFRNTGNPDLLLLAQRLLQDELDPVALLARLDDELSDVRDDPWFLLTTGWLALRHDLVEEATRRLSSIAPDQPAAAHADIVQGVLEYDRGHYRDAAAHMERAAWAWRHLPFLWRCGGCGELSRSYPVTCPRCGGFQSFRMIRPYSAEEPAASRLIAHLPGRGRLASGG
ncbi:MAG: tetratricopeptide repeat protein [Candidatus Dadabacteria bacterium]|nr:MAG: tetratricopeptide repeat protein [Candidatus Dadabacteria bacterium]